jgi:hypothetical protein
MQIVGLCLLFALKSVLLRLGVGKATKELHVSGSAMQKTRILVQMRPNRHGRRAVSMIWARHAESAIKRAGWCLGSLTSKERHS